MAEDRVSRRYATAIFEAAKNAGAVANVESDLSAIDTALKNDGDFRAFLLSPNRGRDEKIALFDKVFGDKVTALTSRLIKLMLEKRREEEIFTVKADFSTIRQSDEGIVHLRVTSAVDLTKDEQKQIVDKLGAKLGKKVEAEFGVDATLQGGVRVAYDDFVIDGSVRGAFARLRETLRHDTLKQA
jgi:F-type H+-transporting ATPase subunit delta